MSQGAPTITFYGNLTGDPELRFTPSGQAVTNFTVACNERKFDKASNEWVDGDATFIRCSAWREMAENVAESLVKGTRVLVTGSLKVRQYETTDGGKGTSVECDVEEVGPSLRWQSARLTRTGTSQAAASRQPARTPARDPWATDTDYTAPPF